MHTTTHASAYPLTGQQMREAMQKPLDQQTPAEIDTQLFPIWGEIQAAQADIRHAKYDGFGNFRGYTPGVEKRVAQAQAKLDAAREKAQPFEAEFDARGGWSRVVHVLNAGGHSHRTMHCPTCHPTTQFGFRPELSGMSEDDIIGAIGETACTVCYPDAPLNPRYKDAQKRTASEKREAAAKKQAAEEVKRQERAAKAISHPDGGKFYGITTHRDARTAIVDALEWMEIADAQKVFEQDKPERVAHWDAKKEEDRVKALRIAEALAHKEGTTPEVALEDARTRLVARNKRNKTR